jgi:hypothetical protein
MPLSLVAFLRPPQVASPQLQVVVQVLFAGNEAAIALAANADGGLTIHLIDHAEDMIRVFHPFARQPGIEAGEILAVEQPYFLRVSRARSQHGSSRCHAHRYPPSVPVN